MVSAAGYWPALAIGEGIASLRTKRTQIDQNGSRGITSFAAKGVGVKNCFRKLVPVFQRCPELEGTVERNFFRNLFPDLLTCHHPEKALDGGRLTKSQISTHKESEQQTPLEVQDPFDP